MKKLAMFAAVCLTATLVACSSTQKSSSVSPGAVKGSNGCSKSCTGASQASPGAVGDKANCPAQCPHAAKASGDQVSPGAVGDGTKKSGCCKAKSSGG